MPLFSPALVNSRMPCSLVLHIFFSSIFSATSRSLSVEALICTFLTWLIKTSLNLEPKQNVRDSVIKLAFQGHNLTGLHHSCSNRSLTSQIKIVENRDFFLQNISS